MKAKTPLEYKLLINSILRQNLFTKWHIYIYIVCLRDKLSYISKKRLSEAVRELQPIYWIFFMIFTGKHSLDGSNYLIQQSNNEPGQAKFMDAIPLVNKLIQDCLYLNYSDSQNKI